MTNCIAESELSMMAAVNGVIDDLHGSLGLAETEFFCECGHTGCKERIKLTRSEYASVRRDDRPLLAANHAHRSRGVAQSHERRVATRASHRSGDPRGG